MHTEAKASGKPWTSGLCIAELICADVLDVPGLCGQLSACCQASESSQGNEQVPQIPTENSGGKRGLLQGNPACWPGLCSSFHTAVTPGREAGQTVKAVTSLANAPELTSQSPKPQASRLQQGMVTAQQHCWWTKPGGTHTGR